MKTRLATSILSLCLRGLAQNPDNPKPDQPLPVTAAQPAVAEETAPTEKKDVFEGLKKVADANYEKWRLAENAAGTALEKVTDPCNTRLINRHVNSVRLAERSYFESQKEYIDAWAANASGALKQTLQMVAGNDPVLTNLEQLVKDQNALIQSTQDRLKALPENAEGARKVAQDLLGLQQDDLGKLKQALQAREKVQESTRVTRESIQLKLDQITEQQKLVSSQEQDENARYDGIVARFALVCTNGTALGDPRRKDQKR